MKTKTKILLARLAYVFLKPVRKLGGHTDHASVRRGGIHWHLDLREGIDLAIYLQGRFEPATAKALKRLVRDGDVVLDIGANIGAHTLPLATLVGEGGKVLAFEPTQYAFGKLQQNLAANPDIAGRVQAMQVQLSAADEASPSDAIYSSWTVIGESQRHPQHAGELKSTDGAQAVTLDTLLTSEGVSKIDFIKLDVDGYECEVLQGAEGTLARFRPTICFELMPYGHEERGYSFEYLIDILSRHGYSITRETNEEPLPMDSAELKQIIGEGGSINVIGRCRENAHSGTRPGLA